MKKKIHSGLASKFAAFNGDNTYPNLNYIAKFDFEEMDRGW